MRSIGLQIPPGYFAGILSSVRSRLVQFMIELKRMFPDQGAIVEIDPLSIDSVNDRFQRAILNVEHVHQINIGDHQNVADRSQNISISVSKGDFDSLGEYFVRMGLSEEAVEKLRPIAYRLAASDGSEEVEKSFTAWMAEQVDGLPRKGVEVVGEATKKATIDGIVAGLKAFAPKMASWLMSVDYSSLHHLNDFPFT